MASALLLLTLVCVLQVMSPAFHALAAPSHNLTAAAPTTSLGIPFAAAVEHLRHFNPDEPDKHDKRSLNVWPYEEKYLSTQHYTLEVLADGTVRASNQLKPEYGILRIFTACSLFNALMPGSSGPADFAKQAQKSNRVSIRGVKAMKYVCMNADGEVYGSTNCTEECRFKQDKIGDGTKFRYYSLKYIGFKDQPARSRKRWYLGWNGDEVLRGYATRKRKEEVQLMLRPVTETSDPRYSGVAVTSTATVQVDTGEPDAGGSVSVVSDPQPSESIPRRRPNNPKRQRPGRRRDRTERKCDDKDPLNLFRFSNCARSLQSGSNRRSGPFSQRGGSSIRHARRKETQATADDTNSQRRHHDRSINLFAFPQR